MIRTITPNKIKFNKTTSKVFKTQQSVFNDHLLVDIPDYFSQFSVKKQTKTEKPLLSDPLTQNNFNIKINNQFVFILLHLRNKTQKNIINIKIPDIIIFNQRTVYDMLFSHKGHIRSYKAFENSKMNLREIFKYIKSRWKQQDSLQHHSACFSHTNKNINESYYTVFTDNQFFLACYKLKRDPFFDNLEYLQSKVQRQPQFRDQQQIKIDFIADAEEQLIKFATQSLLGHRNQEQIIKQLPQQRYLSFCNEKINLFLNYQHNIRIHKATFHYTRASQTQYFLTNVTNLQFSNLTKALRRRQKRLETQQAKRDQIILMSPQKYQKYKSLQKNPQIKVIQTQMSKKFQKIMKAMNINTITQNKRQQVKNQLAFKKLHPKSKFSYNQIITSNDFNKTKRQLFNMDVRKPITRPSKYVMQFYNKVTRSFTQYVQA